MLWWKLGWMLGTRGRIRGNWRISGWRYFRWVVNDRLWNKLGVLSRAGFA